MPRPPNFIKELQSSIAIEGSTYELNCKVDGNPLPTVLWFKNEINIDNSPDYIITYNNGEGILKFEQIFMVDQANYSCKATNRLGDASTSCFLTIQRKIIYFRITIFWGEKFKKKKIFFCFSTSWKN